ncbi:hypothetical protein CRG98_017294 [Punica granatum]|uniref:RNase H type-1 domain-containing protein n=1 Tax=Punica granatum TaxID=22663 RepID=A0A2I0K2E6_PUNGR|nr:hypothetical protein CRG98_017294 [Punica granatum]
MESWPAKTGLDLAWELAVCRLILEVDSEIVACWLILQRGTGAWSDVILREIRRVMQRDWTVLVNHTYLVGSFSDSKGTRTLRRTRPCRTDKFIMSRLAQSLICSHDGHCL